MSSGGGMCGITKLLHSGVCALALALLCHAQQGQPAGSAAPSTTNQSKFDISTLKYENCQPGQSKTVTATVTVTDQNGRSASRSTKITVNCEPPYERFPDLIFAKNEARVNACSRNILIDQVAAAANSGDYNVLLIGHRAQDESETMGNFGPQLDQTRALNAAAALVRCGQVKASSIRIDSAGTAKNPVPTSVACPEYVGPNSDADWYGRVEVYLQPKDGKYLPENAKHLASLPPQLPESGTCGAAAR
jgi:outer membrane protein OmpA-like peptidoglycan-associated protein